MPAAGSASGWRGAGVELDVRRPYAGDAAARDATCRGPTARLLVLGGAMARGRRRRLPWLPDGRGAGPDRRRPAAPPMLGVCLGHQLRRGRPGGRGRRRNPRAARSACSASAGPPAAHADRLLGPVAARDDAPGRAVEQRRRRPGCPTAPSTLARTARRRRCRPPGSAPARVGRAVPPRGRRRRSSGPWADHDRDDAVERGVDLDAFVADVAAARDRAARARGGRSPTAFAAVCRERAPSMSRPVSERTGRPPRGGWPGSASRTSSARRRRALGPAGSRGADVADRTCWRRTADPDQALRPPAPTWPTGVEDRDARCLRALRRRRGHRRCGCSPCSAPARRSATTCCGTPSTGADLTRPDARLDPARGVRASARRCCAPSAPTPAATGAGRGRRRRGGVDALRVAYRRLLLRLAARDLLARASASTTSPPSSPTSPPATLEAALADRPRRGSATPRPPRRLAVIAMGKCGGHELNYVSDVDVIFVAEPAEGVDETAALRAATQLAAAPDADLLRPHRRGHDLAGRRRAAARGQVRPAGAHPGQPRGLLRALGEDLGVPGAAQGPAGRRRPRARRRATCDARRADGVVGRRARRTSSTDVQAMRRRVVEHIPAAQADRELKLGPGGLRDVEFAVQLLQLVHGRTDARCAAPTTLAALAHADRRRLRRPRRRRGAGRGVPVPAHARAPAAARTSCAAPTSLPEDEAALRRLGRSMGLPRDPVAELDRRSGAGTPRGPPAAREALLPAAAGRGRPAAAPTRPG